MVTIVNELPEGWEHTVGEFCYRTTDAARKLDPKHSIQCIELYEQASAFVALVHAKPRQRVPPMFLAELKKLVLFQHDFLQAVCQECGAYGAQHEFPDEHDAILCDHCAHEMTVNCRRFPHKKGRAAANVIAMPNPHQHRIDKIVRDYMSKAAHMRYVDCLKLQNSLDLVAPFADLHRIHAKRQQLIAGFTLYEAARDFHHPKESGQT